MPDNKSIEKERDLIKSEKNQLEKKNTEILREHKYLTNKVRKLEEELKSKRELEKKFNKDIDDLNQLHSQQSHAY